ncbi:hypothetical protein BD770DRAFT_415027 [Pilaira anomala]|nr:hypothetical protein BD770DRAFT_415027 [Pilaira anomala]
MIRRQVKHCNSTFSNPVSQTMWTFTELDALLPVLVLLLVIMYYKHVTFCASSCPELISFIFTYTSVIFMIDIPARSNERLGNIGKLISAIVGFIFMINSLANYYTKFYSGASYTFGNYVFTCNIYAETFIFLQTSRQLSDGLDHIQQTVLENNEILTHSFLNSNKNKNDADLNVDKQNNQIQTIYQSETHFAFGSIGNEKSNGISKARKRILLFGIAAL